MLGMVERVVVGTIGHHFLTATLASYMVGYLDRCKGYIKQQE